MSKYTELKEQHAPMWETFFAFSNEQFDQGMKEAGIEGKKIFSGGAGLYGTRAGIDKLMQFYEEREKRIAENCTPQEVYNYEFSNHECDYVGDDTEAIDIVINYFGAERAREVKRRYAWKEIA